MVITFIMALPQRRDLFKVLGRGGSQGESIWTENRFAARTLQLIKYSNKFYILLYDKRILNEVGFVHFKNKLNHIRFYHLTLG